MVPLKVNRNYRFRLYPSRAQEMKLLETLESCRCLYNYFLGKWQGKDKIPSRYNLQAELPELARENPYYANIHSKTRQYVLFQLYSNLKALSKLKKNGRKVGRVRFKKRGRFKTFVYNQSGFKLIDNGNRYQKLWLSKIGEIPVRAHRKVEGKIKQVFVKRVPSGKWFAILSVETKPKKLGTTGKAIGLDLNIENYLTDSNGERIEHPHILLKLEEKLKREQRKLSRKKKDSRNRVKQMLKLARIHERITDRRRDSLHKLSRYYVNSHDIIGIENLTVRKMMESSYNAKNTADSSWSTFIQMLSYKAEGAGRALVKVDPKNTTQNCSNPECKKYVYKQVWVRTHKCPACGLVMDRDHNAAINILNKALLEVGSVRPELTPDLRTRGFISSEKSSISQMEMRPLPHPMDGACLVKEAGSPNALASG